MTRKKKTEMNFQLTIDFADSTETKELSARSLADQEQKCDLFPERVVRRKETLPNPRKLKNLTFADAIDLNNRGAIIVAQALFEKGIKKIGDLLDKKHVEIFRDLQVTEKQKLDFVIAIENAGVRFTPTPTPTPTPNP